jgi:hypothetical protein
LIFLVIAHAFTSLLTIFLTFDVPWLYVKVNRQTFQTDQWNCIAAIEALSALINVSVEVYVYPYGLYCLNRCFIHTFDLSFGYNIAL